MEQELINAIDFYNRCVKDYESSYFDNYEDIWTNMKYYELLRIPLLLVNECNNGTAYNPIYNEDDLIYKIEERKI